MANLLALKGFVTDNGYRVIKDEVFPDTYVLGSENYDYLANPLKPGGAHFEVTLDPIFRPIIELPPVGSTNNLGWGAYVDDQYTFASPFSIAANTDTILPNNAGASTIETYKPNDITTFYDGTVITGRTGDGISLTIEMKVTPSVAANYVELWIDIGGSIEPLYRQISSFPKGAGVERNIVFNVASAYTLDTWEANGGTVYVRSDGGCDIYGIRYLIARNSRPAI